MSKMFLRAAFAASAALTSAFGVAHAGGTHAGSHMDKIGMPGDPARADRTINVAMGEMFFEPNMLKARKGETIRFVVANDGDIVHEFAIGTAEMHENHASEMMEMIDHGIIDIDHIHRNKMMASGAMHADPNSVLLEPGEVGEVTWTFTKDADLQMSCNVPGHNESGMVGEIDVIVGAVELTN